MPKGTLHLVIVLLLAMLNAACHRESRVEWIEPLTDENPDSALSILRQLSTEHLGDRDRALCDLLLTRAIDKASDTYQTDDSLARAALNYFKKHNDPHFEMLANYYVGQIAYTNKNFSEAIYYLNQGADIAKQLNDHLNLALLYRTFADLYRDTYFGPDAIRYSNLALQEFINAGERGEKYVPWTYNDLSQSHLAAGDYDSCYYYSDIALKLGQQKNIPLLERDALSTKAVAYMQQQKPHAALIALQGVIDKYPLEMLDNSELRTLAMAHGTLGNNEESDKYIKILSDRNYKYYYGYLNSYSSGNYKEAYWKLHEGIRLYNEYFRGVQRSTFADATRSYLQEKQHAEQSRYKANQFKLVVGIVGLILVSTILFLRYYNKVKKERFDFQLKLDELPRLYELTHNLQIENSQLQDLNSQTNHVSYRLQSIRNIIFNEFKEIEKIIADIHTISSNAKRHSTIEKDALQLFEKIKLNQRTQNRLEKEIDDKFEGLMTSFKEDFPNFKETYMMVFIYSILGFSPQSIALFLGTDVNKIYDIKKRIKKLIESHPNKNKYSILFA